MNINTLTVGQIKEIAQLLPTLFKQPVATEITDQRQETSSIRDSVIGKYVICRSRNEGINSGYVKALDETGVVLTEARRFWYHEPKEASQCWYEGVANTGLSDNSKISAPVEEKIISEDYSLTSCTEQAISSIKAFKSHEQG